MYTKMEKKQFIIFLIVAYGVTYLMGLLMWAGYGKSDLSVFPNAQMMYPAAGIMLAYLITRSDDRLVPKGFYRCFILLTVVMIAAAVMSVISPQELETATGSISVWYLAVNYILIGGSVLCWIFLLIAGKERWAAYGLRWRNWKWAVACILLFLFLYFLRTAISYGLGGQLEMFGAIMTSSYTWIYIATMPVNFLLVFVAFFGEEYGWRYYMQPFLQRKFGLRGGVLLLGVVWGLWHLPVDFFYYVSPDQGVIMVVSQIITCVTLGIFFAWAYMKTNNIWVPVILHFMNNNLAPVITGTYSADVLEGQVISWADIPFALIMNGLIFGFFLLAKPFRESQGQTADESKE